MYRPVSIGSVGVTLGSDGYKPVEEPPGGDGYKPVEEPPGGDGYKPVEEPPDDGPTRALPGAPPSATPSETQRGSGVTFSAAFTGALLFAFGAFFLGKRRS